MVYHSIAWMNPSSCMLCEQSHCIVSYAVYVYCFVLCCVMLFGMDAWMSMVVSTNCDIVHRCSIMCDCLAFHSVCCSVSTPGCHVSI